MEKILVEPKLLSSLGDGWRSKVNSFLEYIDSILKIYPDNPEIKIDNLKRVGCDLYLDFSIQGNDQGLSDLWKAVFSGHSFKLASDLEQICSKCGCHKGPPPSLTVRPGLCEKCRHSLTSEDFSGTIAIGMTGKAGAGKDTVADYLVKNHGFIRIALADPIRDIIQLLLVMEKDHIWDRELRELPIPGLPILSFQEMVEKEKNNIEDEEDNQDNCRYDIHNLWSVRKLLQLTGTELFRNHVSREIWVRNIIKRMEPGNNYVVTDVRFPNELDLIKKRFGGKSLFIDVIRDGCDGKDVGLPNHESESYKLSTDAVIENNGSLEDLYTNIENILKDNRVT